MSKFKIIFMFLALCVLCACGGKKGADPQPQPKDPSKSVLLLPAQNEVCTTGENQTSTQSTVAFDWSDADNADKYTFTIKNLLTGEIKTQETTTSDIKLTLLRATPYSWNVTSKSSKTSTTAVSATWKFYNSGVGVTSYAPFAATLIYPGMGEQITAAADSLTLSWTGSDADGDLVGYDVYVGTSSPPVLAGANSGTTQTKTIKVNPNTIYYWKVVTKDAKGNKADSETWQFKTK